MARGDARQQLLDAAIDHVAAHGLHDLSMRALAAELGTSHRMLSHHFGSKDGLWLAIVQEVERRQLAAIGELEAQLTASSPTTPSPTTPSPTTPSPTTPSPTTPSPTTPSPTTPSPTSLPDAMRAWWRHIADPSLWPSERLFFEVYAQALHGREPASQLLDNVVESWLVPATRMAEAMGVAPEDARAFARLGLAVTRGLLLDLLATGDRAGVDAAMEHWIARVTPLRTST